MRSRIHWIVALALVVGATSCSTGWVPRRLSGGSSSSPTPFEVWGLPAGGEKPRPADLVHPTPTLVDGVVGTVVQVSTSNADAYALTSAGTVYAWGEGGSGELGDGARPASSASAVRVDFPPGTRIASLPDPMPFDGGMAIDTGGHAWAWGNDEGRQFCQPDRGKLSRPVEIPLDHVTAAVGALSHTVYDAGGRIVSCGVGDDGQLGNGTTGDSPTPTAVRGLPAGRVTELVASWGDAGVLLADGSFFDWGYNQGGQLGDGTEELSDTAVPVLLPAPVRRVSEGGSLASNGQTVALLDNGQVWEWGDGRSGQMGDGRRSDSLAPRRLRQPSGVAFVQVDSGGATDYAIDRTGQLWAWGQGTSGQLGTGGLRRWQLHPAPTGIALAEVSSTASVVAGFAR